MTARLCAGCGQPLRGGDDGEGRCPVCAPSTLLPRNGVSTCPAEERLEEAVLSYVQALDAGRANAQEWLARHPDLANELRAFLDDQQQIGAALAPLRSEEPSSPLAGARIGDYELGEEIGRGGMGVVYRARQVRLNREVALKMILAGKHTDEPGLQRFRTEALAIARLAHPSIVTVYEVGEHDGRPFLSLELCSGGSLADRLRGTPLEPREAARLVRILAGAMEAAHRASVVHRDLKPANVLLSADGTPRISDFGLARMLDEAGQTQTGAVMGTPSYFAPEQAQALKEVGPAADVYALGAILYECLTGRPPFRAATAYETVLQVIGDDPVPPRQLQPKVPADLETVCLKCLEKAPRKRYASAADLADDLERFLAGEPTAARPVGTTGRLLRWARRRPAIAALTALVLLVTALGFALVTWQWLRAERQQRQAEDEKRRSDRLSARMVFQRGLTLCEAGDVPAGLLWLASSLDLATRSAARDLEPVIRANLASWSARLHPLRLCLDHPRPVLVAVVTRDGRTVATGCEDGRVRFWDARTGQCRTVVKHDQWIVALGLDPSSQTLLAGARDGTVWFIDLASEKAEKHPVAHAAAVRVVRFSRDGSQALTADRAGQVHLWDRAARRPRWSHRFGSEVTAAALDADGSLAALALDRGHVEVWNTRTDGLVSQLPGSGSDVARTLVLAFSGDGQTLLSASRTLLGGPPIPGTSTWQKGAQLWDPRTGKEKARLPHNGYVVAASFHPHDEQTILTGSWDQTARLWVAPGRRRGWKFRLRHENWVGSAVFSPDGETIATSSNDGTVRLWDSARGEAVGPPLHHRGGAGIVGFVAGGRVLVTLGPDRAVRIWDVTPGPGTPNPFPHAGALSTVLFVDEQTLITAGWDRTVKEWKKEGDGWRPGAGPLTEPERVHAVACHPPGRMLLTGYGREEKGMGGARLRLLDRPGLAARELPHDTAVRGVAIRCDGEVLATGCADGKARLWRRQDLSRPLRVIDHPGPVYAVAFSPDGRTLLTGCGKGEGTDPGNCAHTWDVADGRPRLRLQHEGLVVRAVFGPTGRLILTGSTDRTARLWDAETGQEVRRLLHQGSVEAVAFSPDGRRVMTGTSNGKVRVWDVATGQPLGPTFRTANQVRAAAFTPDGRSILYGALAGETGLLPVPAPEAGGAGQVLRRLEVKTGLGLNEDSSLVEVLRPEAHEKARHRLREIEQGN